MKTIYRFEDAKPPFVSEKTLRAELERRRLRCLSALVAVAGLLAELCLLFAAALLFPENAALSYACTAYVLLALSGGGVVALLFYRKRRTFL